MPSADAGTDAFVPRTDSGPPPPTDGGGGCSGALMMCPSGCVDVTTDRYNCGFCSNACSAEQVCFGATCTSEPPPGPVNDTCATALTITEGTPQTFYFAGAVTNHGPFTCHSEYNDVTYVWYPSTSGLGTIDASGAGVSVDTVLGAFSSSACNSTSELGCNDDYTGVASRVTLTVTAGVAVYIVVGSYNTMAPTDLCQLTVSVTPA